MAKSKTPALPIWVRNLRRLMEAQNLNPRSLSLKAGLNSTAVRDMLEGRSRFPRYDTVQGLADALQTTPALLMSDPETTPTAEMSANENLELLTEIIARLQEVASELEYELNPRDFAAMAASLFRRMQDEPVKPAGSRTDTLKPRIHDLLDYEILRNKKVI